MPTDDLLSSIISIIHVPKDSPSTRHERIDFFKLQGLADDAAQLEEEVERYHRILNLVRVGMFEADLAGQFTWVNRAFEEITGLYDDAPLGAGWLACVQHKNLSWVEQQWELVTHNDGPFKFQFQCFNTSTGEVFPLVCVGSRNNGRGVVGATMNLDCLLRAPGD